MFWKTGTIYRQQADAGGGAPSGDEPATPDNTISDEPVSPPITDQPTEPAPKEGGPEEKVVDPAVRAEKEELYQTKYQGLRAIAEAKAPEVVREFEGDKPTIPEVPVDDLDDLDDPKVRHEALKKELKETIRNAVTEVSTEMRTKDRITQEQAHVHNTLRGIQKDLGLDAKTLGNGKITTESKAREEKLWNDAMTAAGQFGIDLEVVGGYGRFGMAMAQQMKLAALTGGQIQQVAQATQTAEEQAREALLVQQPAKGAVPTQKTKTKQQEAIERMEKVKPRSAIDLLDSTHK